MPVSINEEIYYRTVDVCRIVGISRNTLFHWAKTGIIGPEYRDWRGWRLFNKLQVEQMKAMTNNAFLKLSESMMQNKKN